MWADAFLLNFVEFSRLVAGLTVFLEVQERICFVAYAFFSFRVINFSLCIAGDTLLQQRGPVAWRGARLANA